MEPRSATASTEIAFGMPLAHSRVPSMGSTATSHAGPVPSPTSSPLYSIGAWSFSPSPMTTTPRIDTELISIRIALTAAPSAPFLSPRPTHLAAAIAAASVTLASSSARLRSGACLAGSGACRSVVIAAVLPGGPCSDLMQAPPGPAVPAPGAPPASLRPGVGRFLPGGTVALARHLGPGGRRDLLGGPRRAPAVPGSRHAVGERHLDLLLGPALVLQRLQRHARPVRLGERRLHDGARPQPPLQHHVDLRAVHGDLDRQVDPGKQAEHGAEHAVDRVAVQ